MSLDFKKRECGVEGTILSPKIPTKESALSLLLEQSKVSAEDFRKPPSPESGSFRKFLDRLVDVSSTDSARSDTRSEGKFPNSVRIPSSTNRRNIGCPSSLQQQRKRALTGDSSILGTPNSGILGLHSGCGPLFGAGEIGSVSSPRYYSVPIQRDNSNPSSVEERFVVNIPRTVTQASNNTTSSSLARSISKVSLSRSNSRSSFMSLRRFIDKPWKNDSPSPNNDSADDTVGSPFSSATSFSNFIPIGPRNYYQKEATDSFSSGDEDGDSTIGNTSSVLSQLDKQYASSYHGHLINGQRQKMTLKAYGKTGKTLGEGAGGHVKIIKSNIDGQIYAVKEFRARYNSESIREYNKKVGAEYCLGLTLKHPNIVNTLDIIYETDKVYQIMEYAAYDLFAIVMSGKMTKEEIYCDFRQLMEGIRYLHSTGLAHRDLKLDNCVVTEHGIVKIIDFGSSVIYKYPESDKTYDCEGVVGSDPYLAPEASCKGTRYHPTPTDLWSAAIVLCCMLMRKFPWKAPRMSDSAFREFVFIDENGSRPGLTKLLSSLPEETHALLTGMLDLNPETRYDIHECWNDGFLCEETHCTIDKNHLKHLPNHKHSSVSFEDAHIAMLEKKNRKAKKGEKIW